MICIEHGHIYKLEESFDVYMCDSDRITARSGAAFVAERGSNRIVNGRELPFYNIYFLGSKKLSSLFCRLFVSIGRRN